VAADWAWPRGRLGAEPRRRRAGAAEAGGPQRHRAGASRGRWPHSGTTTRQHAAGVEAGRRAQRQAEAHRTEDTEGRGRWRLAGP
jgi:hypothetical protein